MPDFRRGAEAIATAQKVAKSGSDFKAFTPEFFWRDKDEKFLLFLNPLADIPTADLISFIPVTAKKADGDKYTRYERVIAKTDPVIGESNDKIVDEWDGTPRATCIAVAVELEPTYKEVNGRKRPTGFSVKTREFERRIRDEEGELTDQYESVVAPEIGLVHASPHNFFNVITAYDENDAPIEQTPIKVTRVGGDQNTVYSLAGYPEQDIDLSQLIENIDNVYYLANEIDEIVDGIDNTESDFEAAAVIGAYMLDKRLDELVDDDRYESLYSGITESLDRFGGKKKKKAEAKRERPSRGSQRRSVKEESSETNVVEEKPKATRSRAKSTDSGDKVSAMREKLAKRNADAASE